MTKPLVRCSRCNGFFDAAYLQSGRHYCLPPGAGFSRVTDGDIADAIQERRRVGVAFGDHGIYAPPPPREQWWSAVEHWQASTRPMERRPHATGSIGRFHAGTGAAAIPDATWAQFRQPARAATVSSDFTVPMLQTLFTATIAAALSPIGVWPIAQLAGVTTPSLQLYGLAASVAFVLTVAGVWLHLLRESRQSLWQVESYERQPEPETTPEPSQPQPPPRSARVRLEIEEAQPADGGRFRLILQELDIEPETLRTVARAVQSGRSFSVGGLCGRGGPLTRPQLEELRTFLLSRGFLRWRDESNRRGGVEFTGGGKRLLTELAALQVQEAETG